MASNGERGMKILLKTGLSSRKVTVAGTIVAAAWWCESREFSAHGLCSDYIKFGRNGNYNASDEQGGSISADGTTYTCTAQGSNYGPYSILVFYMPG